jgi:hypothetical protein
MNSDRISFDGHNVSDRDKYLIELCMSHILSGRLDQLKLLLSDVDSSKKVNSINKIHDTLYKDSSDFNKTIWDHELNEINNSENWIYSTFLQMLSVNDKEILRNAKISKSSNIASLGSCFATNLARHLKTIGFKNAYTLRVEEAVNSPRLIDMYFNPDRVPSHHKDAWDSRFGIESKNIINIIPKIDIFILTFGVGFDLEDKDGNLCLDLDSIKEKLSIGALKFRNPEIQEQSNYICSCIESIRRLNSHAPVLVTLSPVPLSGFFGTKHVIRANSISKANLLLAIESAKSKSNFIYVPTYEIVTSLAPILYQDKIWGEDGTSRHPNNNLIKTICDSFAKLIF